MRRLLGPVVIVHTGNLRIRESGRLRHVNPELKIYITRTYLKKERKKENP